MVLLIRHINKMYFLMYMYYLSCTKYTTLTLSKSYNGIMRVSRLKNDCDIYLNLKRKIKTI